MACQDPGNRECLVNPPVHFEVKCHAVRDRPYQFRTELKDGNGGQSRTCSSVRTGVRRRDGLNIETEPCASQQHMSLNLDGEVSSRQIPNQLSASSWRNSPKKFIHLPTQRLSRNGASYQSLHDSSSCLNSVCSWTTHGSYKRPP